MPQRKSMALVTMVNLIAMMVTVALALLSPSYSQGSDNGSPVISAREVRLVDAEGGIRAGIKMDKGVPVFYLVNRGKVAGYWGCNDKGCLMIFKDSQGQSKIAISVNSNDDPSLIIYKEEKKPAVYAGWKKGSGARLIMRGEAGERTAMLQDMTHGMMFGFLDQDKKARLMMGVSDKGLPRMVLCDSQAKTVAALAVQDDAPALIMQKKPGSRMVASTLPDGEAYVSIARDDEIVWKQPADLGIPAGPRVLPDAMLDDLLER